MCGPFFSQYNHYFINIVILLSISSIFYQYYQYFIIIIIILSSLYIIANKLIIGTKILKQKCFGRKPTFSTRTAISSRLKKSPDRAPSDAPCPVAVGLIFWGFFRKFACGLGFAAWRRRTDGTDGRTEDDDDGGHDGRTHKTQHNTTQHNTNYVILSFSISIVYPSNKTRTDFVQYAK